MNHLMIGIGGSGGRVLAGIRKRWLQRYGSEKPPQFGADFLLIDESPALAQLEPSDWSLLGRALQLPRRQQFGLELALTPLAAALADRPSLRRGLGQPADGQALPVALAALEDGLGRRRLAHWALSGQIDSCRERIEQLVADLCRQSERPLLCWHVFCHLGGGIGAGALPGLLQLLRRQSQDPASRLVVYAILPAAAPAADASAAGRRAEAVQARSYATLLELAALQRGNRAGDAERSAFEVCYLSRDPEAVEQLAEFAAQKIAGLGGRWELLTRLDSGRAVPATGATGAAADRPADRFVGLGLQQLGPDEARLLIQLGHEQALRVLHQLRYDHWRPALGYVDQPRSSAPPAIDAALRQRWGLSDAALQLQPDAAAGPAPAFEAEWHEYERHFLALVGALPEAERLERLRALFEQAWDGGLRGQGVERYYAQADDELFHLADAGVRRIETELLQDWRDGRRGLHDCGRLVAALMADLAPRGEQCEARAARHEAAARHHEQQLAAIGPRTLPSHSRWTQRLTGAAAAQRSLDLANAATLLRERAIALTRARAERFAERHARQLASRLGDLLHLIDALELTLGTLASQFQADALDHLPPRDADAVSDERRRCDDIRHHLLSQETPQREHAAQLRQALFETLGERASLRTFALELAEEPLCGLLLARSAERAQRQLQQLPRSGLWQLLAERQDSETGLAPALQALVGAALRSQPAAALDGGGLADAAALPVTADHWGLVLPAPLPPAELLPTLGPDLAGVITRELTRGGQGDAALLRLGHGASGAGLPALQLDLLQAGPQQSAPRLPQPLTLISLAPQPGLSEAAWLRPLHVAYERCTLRAGALAAALHADGDASRWPALLAPQPNEQLAQARRLLLLAVALGVVQDGRDAQSSAPRLLLLRLDADGFELERKVLGATLAETARQLDTAALRELYQTIQELDLPRLAHDPARHDALRSRMRAQIDVIRADAEAAQLDAVSLAWNDAARAVMRFVRQEALL